MSGDSIAVFDVSEARLVPSSTANYNKRNGHLVVEFDDTTDETLDFIGIIPQNYSAGGLTVRIIWLAKTATSGTVRWSAAFERHDAATDLDSDSFASANTVGDTTNATSGAPTYTAISFTSGGEVDDLTAGDHFRLRIMRDADGTSGTDNMVGDAQIIGVDIRES